MKRYPEDVQNLIKANVCGRTVKELVDMINAKFGTDFTDAKMRSYKKNHGFKSNTPRCFPKGKSTRLYPEEVKRFIETNYHGTGHRDMAELLNRTFGTHFTKAQMKAYYGRNKLDSGLNGRFAPGHVPANKGIKGAGGWEPTQFKKGHVPVNYRTVGSERVNVDGYTEIKVADPNKWRLKHQVVWETANGPIPQGYAVIFGDGNKGNFDADNLILVSRGQLATLNHNGLIQNNADLTRSAIIITDIYHKISERTKKN